jgi:hypothetical protein
MVKFMRREDDAEVPFLLIVQQRYSIALRYSLWFELWTMMKRFLPAVFGGLHNQLTTESIAPAGGFVSTTWLGSLAAMKAR